MTWLDTLAKQVADGKAALAANPARSDAVVLISPPPAVIPKLLKCLGKCNGDAFAGADPHTLRVAYAATRGGLAIAEFILKRTPWQGHSTFAADEIPA
jgi:hypothetical protein